MNNFEKAEKALREVDMAMGDWALKQMIKEMYGAYKVQCKFLRRLVEIHEEWDKSPKTIFSMENVLNKVHNACQRWKKAREKRGAPDYQFDKKKKNPIRHCPGYGCGGNKDTV